MKIKLLCVVMAVACLLGVLWERNSSSLPVEINDSAKTMRTPKPVWVEAPQDDAQGKAEPKPGLSDADSTAVLLQRIQTALASGNGADQDLILSKLLPELVRSNPRAAAHFVESLTAFPLREEAMRLVAQKWATQDAQAAENWAAQLPDQNERNSMVSAVCFQIAQTDARQAVAIAVQHGLASGPGAEVESLVQQWAGQDFPSAVSWVKELPAGDQRDQMVTRLAFVQSQISPAQAAQLVVEEIPPGPVQSEAAITVVYQWGMHDMQGAKAWVERFPPGEFRDRAENELASIAVQQASK